ncbi:MAG: hypothetical protein IT381_23915 [Deltaproteobacteria bacterium]|nr:hypothetical protein [Deltaproteobacteria bacterium]
MKKLAVLSILLSACGPAVPTLDTKGITNPNEAAKATARINDAIDVVALSSPARESTATSTFTRDCKKGGTKTGTVTGKLVGSTTGRNGTTVPTYDLEFRNCQTDSVELYGTATWSYGYSSLGIGSARHEIKLSGTLGVKLDNGALQTNATFKDLSIDAQLSRSGTTTNREIEIKGSVEFGGKVYTLKQEDFSGAFADPE